MGHYCTFVLEKGDESGSWRECTCGRRFAYRQRQSPYMSWQSPSDVPVRPWRMPESPGGRENPVWSAFEPTKEWPDRLGDWLADCFARWVLRLHGPIEGPNLLPWCKPCRTSWPCDTVIAVDRRMKDRAGR